MAEANYSLTALDGVRVGNYQRMGRGWLTGTTVVFTPRGATAGVDVRGGGPGTRETDVLRPENLVQQVHAICLSDGVLRRCAELGVGLQTGQAPHEVVPIVPTAIIYDLARGGRFDHRPDAEFGYQATAVASRRPVRSGNIGAGAGAVAAGLKGGLGNALHRFEDGIVVASLAVVNAAGSLIDPESGLPWLATSLLKRPDREDRRRLAEVLAPRLTPLNTTIGVVATNAALTKSECTKLAQVAHDGLARAANPSHLLVDGDTIFALSTTTAEVSTAAGSSGLSAPDSRTPLMNRLLTHAANTFASACLDAVLSATSVPGFPSYRDLCPSAVREA